MELLDLIVNVAYAAKETATEAENANPGLLGTFGINWKLFLAQLINFSIVVFILSKYVFGPISKKLSERSEKIQTALDDAKKIEEEKAEFEKWKTEAETQARQTASNIITQATTEAEMQKKQILEQTRLEQSKIITNAKAQIEDEEQKMVTNVKGEMADMITKATEKILKQKLDSKKDEEMIKGSLKNL
jgi:F-type H+-transporting ATPase subunit b